MRRGILLREKNTNLQHPHYDTNDLYSFGLCSFLWLLSFI